MEVDQDILDMNDLIVNDHFLWEIKPSPYLEKSNLHPMLHSIL